jgi:hypothetical protein
MGKDNKLKEKLRKIIVRESEACMGKDGSKLSQVRTSLKSKYLGHGYEVDESRKERGLSTYVDRTVMETVEWAKPGLMRVFCGEEIIRFDPRSPEDEQAASDATLYVNQAVFSRNMFKLVHDVLTEGLYQRVGWCLAHCPERAERKVSSYTGLTQQEAEALLMDPSVGEADVEVERVESPYGDTFDVIIRRDVQVRDIILDPVPSEHVIISADAQDVEKARFVAHWQMKTASDLLKEGYSRALIEELPKDTDDDMPETGVGRRVNDDSDDDEDGVASESRRYRIYEAWFDADINGDGKTEKVKAVYCGDSSSCVVLKWEEWPLYRAPLFAACSVPMPHQVVGLCVADLVTDMQDLKTEMMRQYLDNLALSNQAELVVNEGTMGGEVEYDSLLARGVGAVHRISGDASITPLPVATSAGEALQGVTMAEQLVERRTGVSSRTQSIQADVLQNTATGANIMEEAINQRLELIARVYAEMFFKPLGRYLLHLLHTQHNKQIQLRLKGKYMAFDPRRWNPDMEISVAVGLGTGNRAKLMQHYQTILTIQQAFMSQLGAISPVRLSHLVYTCHKMVEAAGLEAPERFFGTDDEARKAEQAMANQPQNDVEAQKLELDKQTKMGKLQIDRQKAENEMKIKAFEAQSKMALAKQAQDAKVMTKLVEIQGEKELDHAALMRGDRSSGRTDLRGQRM